MSLAAKFAPESAKMDWLSAADSIATEIAARAAKHDAEDLFVADAFARLKAEGFFKMHVPAELGGHGADYAEVCAVVRTLAAACGSTGLAFSMHSHLVAVAAWRWRNEKAPTDGLLKRVAAENLILISSGGIGLVEERRHGDESRRRLSHQGAQDFLQRLARWAILLMTSAVTEDPQAGPTVLHFAVPFKAEGVKILDTWRVMGMRGTGSNDVELNDVFVADAAISGRRPQGKWHHLFHIISMLAFPIIYSAYMGVADGARAKALQVARKKSDDGHMADPRRRNGKRPRDGRHRARRHDPHRAKPKSPARKRRAAR